MLVFVAGGGTIPPALAKKLKEVGADERAPESEKTADVLTGEAHEPGSCSTADAAKLIGSHLGDDAGRVAALVDVLDAAFGAGAQLDRRRRAPLPRRGRRRPVVPAHQRDREGRHRRRARGPAPAAHRHEPAAAEADAPAAGDGACCTGYYRRLLRLDDPSIRSAADAIAALGGKVKEFPARKALDQARALGTDGIRQAFDALYQADLDLKGARGIPETR